MKTRPIANEYKLSTAAKCQCSITCQNEIITVKKITVSPAMSYVILRHSLCRCRRNTRHLRVNMILWLTSTEIDALRNILA
jgi:hypothetical protein